MMFGMNRNLLTVVVVSAAVAAGGCGAPAPKPQPRTVPIATADPASAAPAAPGQVPAAPDSTCHMLGTSPADFRPDPACTPGAVDPAVTEDNLDQTICAAGYTARVRPPVSVTSRIKAERYRAYGLPSGTPSELDHLVSLELGGAPSAVANLWPEPGAIPNPKDSVENQLHRAVCSHRVTLAAAQQAITADWTTALGHLGLSR
jgi:hypothetical protein